MVGGKPYILCADDLQMHQIVITEMLEDEFNLACTNSGVACIESIVKQAPELVLLGDKMPLSSGHDTCQLLRESEQYKDIPIISLTENNSEDVSRKQCDAYLNFPIDKEELIDSIRQLLK